MEEIIVILTHPPDSKDNCMICNVFLRSLCTHNAIIYGGYIMSTHVHGLAHSQGEVMQSLHVSA